MIHRESGLCGNPWTSNAPGFDQLTSILRGIVRQAEGRASQPGACLIDSQSIKTSATVPLTGQGIDPARRIIGRKRHIVTDTLGLLPTVYETHPHRSVAMVQLTAINLVARSLTHETTLNWRNS